MNPGRSMSRRSESAEGGTERARALVARAWRARREALESPPTDDATLVAVMSGVEADLVRACEMYEHAGARSGLSAALGKLGHVALDLDDTDRARALFEESVAVAREAEDPLRLAHAVRHLGQVNHRLGRLESAGTCYEEALDLYDRAGTAHPVDHANALRPMAALREELGDVRGARLMWRWAAELYGSAGVEEGVDECEARLSGLAQAEPGDRGAGEQGR
ncbi:MAG: tetratricopeptide repeat protein [Gemmatimonadetes bacterium]|nr:tetratricopeptide repeat protein [Gemmatimonadota bacterium]MYC91613.1 tetratricopeptide repeat protein [Gemmatimonadota bacterium]MYJ17573.1 tetratricopeptide repeat protein [Gemmatimonadota bacterium]